MLKKTIIFLFMFFVFIAPVKATYDPFSVSNNLYGIHILETTEIEKAAELVNSSGGDWGYVTIPIRANERDLNKWTEFMNKAKEKHIIPILRIASFPVGDHWMAPNEYDLIDFANFLDQLPWPTANRYIVVYNEPNHESEWGGFVSPGEYARVLDRAIDIFHKRNPDFFVISAGLDASAPNGNNSMSAYDYEWAMNNSWPGIFERVDGLSFHAYGNPAFSTYPNSYSRVNISSYHYEYSYSDKKPIFLTEAGWKSGGWYMTAFENFWIDQNIVAITPFLLSAQNGPFIDFSFIDNNNQWKPFARELMITPKTSGKPQIASENKALVINKPSDKANISPSSFSIDKLWKMISDIINSWIGR